MTTTKTATVPNAGYNQATFWRTADGIFYLIDDLEFWHRVNICRFLIDKAASRYLRKRTLEIISSYWSFVAYAADKDWGPIMDDDEPDSAELLRMVRREQDKGMHLDWMRSTSLFLRMIDGIDPRQLGPGVLGA